MRCVRCRRSHVADSRRPLIAQLGLDRLDDLVRRPHDQDPQAIRPAREPTAARAAARRGTPAGRVPARAATAREPRFAPTPPRSAIRGSARTSPRCATGSSVGSAERRARTARPRRRGERSPAGARGSPADSCGRARCRSPPPSARRARAPRGERPCRSRRRARRRPCIRSSTSAEAAVAASAQSLSGRAAGTDDRDRANVLAA